MQDHGGVGHGYNPPSPHANPHILPPPPAEARHWPAEFPDWLSSLSPEPPSSPQRHPSTPPLPPRQVSSPSPPGTPPVKITAEMGEKDKEQKPISAGIYKCGVWESTV